MVNSGHGVPAGPGSLKFFVVKPWDFH